MDLSGQRHAPAALPPGKIPLYPLDRRLGGPRRQSGRGDEEKKSLPLPAIKPWSSSPSPNHYTVQAEEIWKQFAPGWNGVEHVTRRNAYRILAEYQAFDMRITLKSILGELVLMTWIGFSWFVNTSYNANESLVFAQLVTYERVAICGDIARCCT
jgi:hypothetical protein